jgi:hypothetical protein
LGNASNADPSAGGGARDLRCRPAEMLRRTLRGHELRRDPRSRVYEVEVSYLDAAGQQRPYLLEYSVNDPDASRPNETRIRRAGYFPLLAPAALADPPRADEEPGVRRKQSR